MTVYARYDGNNAPSYITPGKLYEVSQEVGRQFNITNDMGRGSLCLWGGCAHLNGYNWTRVESHPAAAILREIADEAAVNPEPHLAFEQRCLDGLHTAWRTPNHLQVLLYSACRDIWQVRRKPKTVRVEGEVPQSSIEAARFLSLHGGGGHGEAQIVARALLELVEGE